MRRSRVIIATFYLIPVVSAPVRGLDPISVLTPSDVPAGWGNGFGLSVAISGNYLVIGAPWDPWYNGSSTGAAYVFRRYGPRWIEQAKLRAADPVSRQLGWSVAIDGDVIVAGAPRYFSTERDEGGPGAVYVFRRDDHGTPDDPTDDTWPQEAKLTAPNPQLGQLLGISVGISGDVIVAGKPRVGDSVEVFRWNPGPPGQWLHEASLIGSDTPVDWDEFGWSVDIDAENIVVGAYGHNEARGAAYVFVRDGMSWVEDDKLIASDTAPGDGLGWSVSISCHSVAVGAPGDDDAGPTSGSAYLFAPEGPGEWREKAKVVPPDAFYYDSFGYWLSIDQDLALVGRSATYTAGRPLGWLLQRQKGLWRAADTLSGSADFHSVAINGNYAAVSTHVYAVRNQRTLRDYAAFQNCISEKAPTVLCPSCQPFDLTGDGRVDLADFEEFIGTFVGPQN